MTETPINSPRSTLEDLENDAAALEMAIHVMEDYVQADALDDVDGDPEACVAWLQAKLAETRNSIDALDGFGDGQRSQTATVLVTIEGGLIQDVSADLPGLRVIIQEYDKDMEDNPAVIQDDNGERAWMQDWRPHGDAQERKTVARGAGYADRATAQDEGGSR